MLSIVIIIYTHTVTSYRIAGNFRGVLIFVIFVTIPRVTKFSTHEIFHPRIFSRLLRIYNYIGLRESRNLKPRKLILKTRDSFSRKFAPPKITRYTVYSAEDPPEQTSLCPVRCLVASVVGPPPAVSAAGETPRGPAATARTRGLLHTANSCCGPHSGLGPVRRGVGLFSQRWMWPRLQSRCGHASNHVISKANDGSS